MNKVQDLAKRARTKDYWYAEDGTLMVWDVYANRHATLVDTQTDGNVWLAVLDNAKKLDWTEES